MMDNHYRKNIDKILNILIIINLFILLIMSIKLVFTRKTRNYFYDLPKVLQDYIYFFDDTYHELNNLCIEDMKKMHKINIRSCFIMGPYHIGQIINKEQYIDRYIDLWQNSTCLDNKHTIVILIPYGAITKCTKCEILKYCTFTG